MFSRIFSRSHVTTYSVTVSYLLVNRRHEIRNGYTMFMLRNFEKEFQKRIASEFDVNVVISLSDVKENRHAAKDCNLLAEISKRISIQKCIDS